MLGNAGRNAFGGPGFYNVDLSIGRSFGLRWLGEGGRLAFRADAFNVLNHANLGNPFSLLTDSPEPNFGVAPFGRQGPPSGFQPVSRLKEAPRATKQRIKLTF